MTGRGGKSWQDAVSRPRSSNGRGDRSPPLLAVADADDKERDRAGMLGRR
jgi:hypothetical protein